jgi:hypothetical protein
MIEIKIRDVTMPAAAGLSFRQMIPLDTRTQTTSNRRAIVAKHPYVAKSRTVDPG